MAHSIVFMLVVFKVQMSLNKLEVVSYCTFTTIMIRLGALTQGGTERWTGHRSRGSRPKAKSQKLPSSVAWCNVRVPLQHRLCFVHVDLSATLPGLLDVAPRCRHPAPPCLPARPYARITLLDCAPACHAHRRGCRRNRVQTCMQAGAKA